ncbi:MAG TPA: ISNCY family transposase [Terriglobales bacterium]|nr:ISNCY family transposase [Terriglobales bacterium]
MSSRELERVEVMGRVASGDLKLSDAAVMLELSYRQVKRLWRRYRQVGRKGLKHGNAGRPSNRSKAMKLRRRVLNLIKKKYSGSEKERFGPTLAAEHLAEEDGMVVDHETLRRWMLGERLWSQQRRRKKHCQRRERKAHFGELVQLDGSFHEWFEGRGPRGCLMDMVDDATGKTQARMGKEETIWAAVGVLRAWIEQYGVPRALYTDWKNVYQQKATPAEQLRGKVPVTQFGRMCQKLGIRIIAASSPQAKGRVERTHGVHQDRLIKKMRRKKIASYEAANEYLEKEYLPEHNRRFARVAAKPEDYHGRKPTARELREVFRLETERRISNDWVIRHEGRYWQLQPAGQPRYGPTLSKALVCEWEVGVREVYYRGERIAFTELKEPIRKISESLPPAARAIVVRKAKKDHPWRQAYKNMRPWGPNQVITTPLVGIRTYASP